MDPDTVLVGFGGHVRVFGLSPRHTLPGTDRSISTCDTYDIREPPQQRANPTISSPPTRLAARGLPLVTWQANPSCRLVLGDQIVESKKNRDTGADRPATHARWNQEFEFLVSDPTTQVLELMVVDTPGQGEVGATSLSLSSLPINTSVGLWIPLERVKRENSAAANARLSAGDRGRRSNSSASTSSATIVGTRDPYYHLSSWWDDLVAPFRRDEYPSDTPIENETGSRRPRSRYIR